MGVYSYPPEIEDFVREWSPKLRDIELAELVNERFGTEFTKSKIKSYRANHHIRNGKKQWTKEEYWKYQKRYPQGMYEFVRDNSWGISSKEMAEMVNEKFGTNFSQTGMKQFRQRHGIKCGLTGWFQKAHPPANKGKKLEEYIKDEGRVKEIRRRIAATQFKKGERPKNELPLGTIVANKDGYKLIKVKMQGYIWDRWKPLHRFVWEKHNGPIPENMCITFKDSNSLNCDISNLMLVTREESAALTAFHYRSHDPDLTTAGLNVIRLKNSAAERRKKNELPAAGD